jgi:outer membrane protein, multidrug efflux system
VAARLRLGFLCDLTLAALLLSGCTVGPSYVRPRAELPPRFLEQGPDLRHGDRMVGAQWWTGLGDPVLDRLVGEALAGSPSLQIASYRIIEAREELAGISTEELPLVDAQGAYARQHGSENVPIGTPPGGLGPGVDSNLWLAGFDMSWEADLFGGTRRAIESASASAAAARADRQEAELSLVAEIAREYVELRTEQRRWAIAEQIRSSRRTDLELVMARFDSGLAGALDAARARADLDDSEAQIPAIEAAVRAAIYRLGTLVGQPPERLLPLLIQPRPIPAVHTQVPIGLPSDLLERRPDIRAAERRVAAANARIGMREAELFPQFSLTGEAGLESLDAGNFVSGGSRYFAIGPSITWLIFDAGRIRDEVLAQRARTNAATAKYRETVLSALDEVETALVTYGRAQIKRNALIEEVGARQQALTIAQRLYTHGIEDFLPVLDAERTLYASRMSLASADAATTDSYIALVKALGGGWANPNERSE